MMMDHFFTQNLKPNNASFFIAIAGKIPLSVCIMIAAAAIALAAPASTAYAKPLEYAGSIPFEDSKNVTIRFYLSDDAKEVSKINFKMDELALKPKDEKSGISNVVLSGAELDDETLRKIVEGKLRSDEFFFFDLTVIDSCIYGSIGINYEIDDGTVKGMTTAGPVYAVIPNVTTPMDIPDNIMKK
jgi:hypothetical protein